MYVKFKSGNDLVVNPEKSFGVMKFAGLGREDYKYETNPETGRRERTEEMNKRVYDVKSRKQRTIIEINIEPDVPIIDFPHDAEVELVNVRVNTFASGGESIVMIEAGNIILKKSGTSARKLPEKLPEKTPGTQNKTE